MKIITIQLLILSSFISFIAHSQSIGIGDWQIHSSYNAGIGVVEHNEELYVACKYGMFKYNINNNELSRMSKVDNLSDNDFSAIGYHKKHGAIVIGYTNGNIDIVKNNVVYNISSVKKAQNILGSKKINHVEEYGDYVFVSTDFGVLKIDIINPSIKETYKNLTVSGNVLRVNKTLASVKKDSVFMATNIGVMAAKLSSPNLIDYSQWTLYDSTNFIAEREAIHIIEHKNTIYAVLNLNNVFRKKGENWERLPLDVGHWLPLNGFQSTGETIQLSFEQYILFTDENIIEVKRLEDKIFMEPAILFQDSKGKEYVVDKVAGFFSQKPEGNFNYLNPNGPFRPDAFDLEYINGQIIVTAGGYSGRNLSISFNNNGYFSYDYERGWKHYPTSTWSPPAIDISDVAYHENRKETYFASYAYGLVVKDDNDNYSVFYDSSLVTTANPPFISPLKRSYIRARIATVETDRDGNVWFANFFANGNPQIYKVNPDGTWSSLYINSINADQISRLKFDLDNNIWAISRGGLAASAVMAITKEGQLKKLFTANELFADPNYVEIDKKGDIWVGTNEGIVIIKNENKMNGFEIERPIIDGRYLLESEVINSIVVDGANRKWVATTDGLWLFNEDGTKLIHHFTVDNSPLLSNRIQDIAIHPESGEVFIGTDLGINSYRGQSTESTDIICKDPVKVFPNPVPPAFSGFVGINGLPENALVKITDLSGKLVYETNAQGGQAVWNARTINGEKVKTGVYTAYISSTDTENTCVTKIAVIE